VRLLQVHNTIVEFAASLSEQLRRTKLKLQTSRGVKSRRKLIRRLKRFSNQVAQLSGRALDATSMYPLRVRLNCPAANSCVAQNLGALRSRLTGAVRGLRRVSRQALAFIVSDAKGRQSNRSLRLKRRKYSSLASTALALAQKLPNENEECPIIQ
jgi:hypothetical protein